MIFKNMLSKKRTGKNTKQNASTIDITHPAIVPKSNIIAIHILKKLLDKIVHHLFSLFKSINKEYGTKPYFLIDLFIKINSFLFAISFCISFISFFIKILLLNRKYLLKLET